MPLDVDRMKKIISTWDFEQVWMYNLYDSSGSFMEVARETNRSANSVRDRMLAANRSFESIFSQPLMTCKKGRYELTQHGQLVGRFYYELAENVCRALDSIANTRITYTVPCVTTLMDYFYEFRALIPDDAGFDLRVQGTRTADLQIHNELPASSRIAFGCILGGQRQNDADGTGIELGSGSTVRLFVLRSEPLYLLAKRSLRFGRNPDINDVLDRGVTILMPSNGVAWEYMQQNASHWHIRRPYQHRPIPYRDSGLQQLRHEENAAMVIHGEIDRYLKDNPSIVRWPLRDREGREHHALSGLIVDPRANGMDDDHFDLLVGRVLPAFMEQYGPPRERVA